VFRTILNAVPLTLLLVAVVVISLGPRAGPRLADPPLVPATGEGFHAEVSAPMLSVVGCCSRS
jgi:hypothetical protein